MPVILSLLPLLLFDEVVSKTEGLAVSERFVAASKGSLSGWSSPGVFRGLAVEAVPSPNVVVSTLPLILRIL